MVPLYLFLSISETHTSTHVRSHYILLVVADTFISVGEEQLAKNTMCCRVRMQAPHHISCRPLQRGNGLPSAGSPERPCALHRPESGSQEPCVD